MTLASIGESHESAPSVRRRDLTKALRFAVASTHGIGAGMTGNELIAYVLEHGLLSSVERASIQARRDAAEARDTTIS